MINIETAKKEFKNYIQAYDPKDAQVAIKIAHILRTAKVSKKTAEYLKLEENDIQLAELIGLLHDIGRFEQIKRFHTFLDKDSINHAEFGVELLFKEGLIRKFIQEDQYDNIIKKAIWNHNKLTIEEGLNEKELLHAKIIRDSDKTDIFYVLTMEDIKAIYGKTDVKQETISEHIVKEFIENKSIDYTHMEKPLDNLVAQIAYIYDIRYYYGIKVIYENKYLDKLIDRFQFENPETIQVVDEMKKMTNQYMEKRLKEEETCLRNY